MHFKYSRSKLGYSAHYVPKNADDRAKITDRLALHEKAQIRFTQLEWHWCLIKVVAKMSSELSRPSCRFGMNQRRLAEAQLTINVLSMITWATHPAPTIIVGSDIAYSLCRLSK